MNPDYSHNDKLPPLTEKGKAELKEHFDRWFTGLLAMDKCSCLERDVLRNQKQNLLEEWIRVRPYYTDEDEIALGRKNASQV
jgi:hypothetical protein